MWKANKVPDKELAPSTLGHQSPFEYQRVTRLGLPLLWILEAGTALVRRTYLFINIEI